MGDLPQKRIKKIWRFWSFGNEQNEKEKVKMELLLQEHSKEEAFIKSRNYRVDNLIDFNMENLTKSSNTEIKEDVRMPSTIE